MSRAFFETLFDSSASLLVSGSLFDRRQRTVDEVIKRPGEFFTINELTAGGGRDVTDVKVFRNFLIELDFGTLVEQVQYIETLKLPYTSVVYSGGKSVHYIMSLEEPLKTAADYYEFSDFLLEHVVHRADKSNKNPNRYSRTPGVVRSDKGGRTQELIELRPRVTPKELEEFLAPYWKTWLIEKRKRERSARLKRVKRELAERNGITLAPLELITARTKDFILNGATEGDRHRALTSAITDLYLNGMELPEIEALLQTAVEKSGIAERGDLEQLINWAERKLVR